jgi:hypothetical protein
MITLTLTAEYDPANDQWEVLLPNGIDQHKLVFKQPLVETPEEIEPTWTDDELQSFMTFAGKPASEIAQSIQLEGGGLEEAGIDDGAEWSIAQRQKIEGRYK